MKARAFGDAFFYIAALLACDLLPEALGVEVIKIWTVTGSGSSALRDYVSDGVGNATQDADYGGLYLPFYTEGTGVGQAKFVNSTVDYTIGDYQLSSSLYSSVGRPIVQFPIALGAVALYHNITGYSSPNTLRINSSVAAQIFTGNITYWDNPQILALNPNLTRLDPNITEKKITVIVRTDSVAAGQAFSKWLNLTAPQYWSLGVNSTIPWPKLPNFQYVQGGSALTAAVAATPYSIAFSDAYAGKKAKLTDAAVQNKNLDWVKYSQANWTFSNIGNDTITWPSLPTSDWSSFSIVNLGGNKTYPIPTAAFAGSNVDLRDKEDRGAAQQQMFGYLLGPYVASQAPVYQEFTLPPAWLNYSIWATTFMKVRSSKIFFEPDQLPQLGNPYNAKFVPNS